MKQSKGESEVRKEREQKEQMLEVVSSVTGFHPHIGFNCAAAV